MSIIGCTSVTMVMYTRCQKALQLLFAIGELYCYRPLLMLSFCPADPAKNLKLNLSDLAMGSGTRGLYGFQNLILTRCPASKCCQKRKTCWTTPSPTPKNFLPLRTRFGQFKFWTNLLVRSWLASLQFSFVETFASKCSLQFSWCVIEFCIYTFYSCSSKWFLIISSPCYTSWVKSKRKVLYIFRN